ncbi:multicopper oxidase domain-containing protein, partial [Escherichia coli]|uniref:multicopper oxidase domain-containing protein n=1 Tax=Escherichia coli TaxID=562 RepID=UPI00207B43D3
ARFKVINHDGQKPAPADFGWKDTVWIEKQSELFLVGKQNGWERWLVTVETPQPFHIEGARFKVINHDGQKPAPADFGWKDTVWIEKQSEL